MVDAALNEPVERFIADVGADLRRVSRDVKGVKTDRLTDDVAVEASNLVAAFIDADGRHTDEELWAFLATFAPRFDTVLQYASPADVRKAGLVAGKRAWLERPSTLFEILALGDGAAAHTYYERAMAIAHAVCSLDAVPSDEEMDALDRFRTMLLAKVDTATPVAPAPPEPELAPARPLEELLAELDGLIGLDAVKREVKLVTDLIQVQKLRRERGLPVVDSTRHLVFTGNPGTGKTTVARLLAQIYRTLGVLKKGQLVETDRPGLVAGFVGQTALKVKDVFDRAVGGFLLIDEAYALARGGDNDFGREAIDTIVKLIEDHRDEIVVVAAGYPDEMGTFIDANPGLRSRFPKTIHFPDYTTDELLAIFASMCEDGGYRCTVEAHERVRALLDAQPREKGFGNGRLVRNLFEATMAKQASRVVGIKTPSDEQLMGLEPDDIAT